MLSPLLPHSWFKIRNMHDEFQSYTIKTIIQGTRNIVENETPYIERSCNISYTAITFIKIATFICTLSFPKPDHITPVIQGGVYKQFSIRRCCVDRNSNRRKTTSGVRLPCQKIKVSIIYLG